MLGELRSGDAFSDRPTQQPVVSVSDVERRNAKSVQRSQRAHHESSHAGDTQVPDSVRSVISSSGQQLDESIQRAMEERMGDNLGDVRIHTGPQAAKACDDINARAFTVGNHVAFNSGEYDPESAEGLHVLAHELAHVRQQTGGAVSMLPQKGELQIDPDERLEREAEETADRVMRGGVLGVQRMRKGEMHVQRMDDGVTASNAKGIQELKSELGDLKTTVQSHEETIKEVESMRDAVDGAYDDMDPEDVELNIPGMEDQDRSMLEEIKTSLGDMGEKMNPFAEDGQKTMLKGAVGGGLALGAFLLGGGVLGAAAATMAPILGDAAAAGIGDGSQAVPAEVVETLGQSLAASEDFAKRIANDPTLAEQLASNDTLLSSLQQTFDAEGQTGGANPMDNSGE